MNQKKFIELKKRWRDPVLRIHDTFSVRKADGTLTPLIVPESQRKLLRDGILCRGYQVMKNGGVVNRVINKGRQIGCSIISAAEAILIAQDNPNTFQYYVATGASQGIDWMAKLHQLVLDANRFPPELSGKPMLTATNLNKAMSQEINHSKIVALPYNPGGMRGPTAINVMLDEFAWMITKKNQQNETYQACKYFLRQGGQLSILSTPRTKADMFMRFYESYEQEGFLPYYMPVITNWKELNLNEPLIIHLDNADRKALMFPPITDTERERLIQLYGKRIGFIHDEEHNIIYQPAKIPYSWIAMHALEKNRRADVEYFKQENLGIAIDDRYKVIIGEWIYQNLIEGTDHNNRGDSFNPFIIGIDIAKQQDLFIISVFEKIDNHYFLRRAEIMPPGQEYPISQLRVEELYDAFKPIAIRVDNTGGGIIFCDYLEKGRTKSVLQRVNFNTSTKTNMAENLRNIARDNKLHMLNYTPEHQLIIKHLLKVEKQVLESSVKYSGKALDQEGRDDGFWSVALAVCDNPHRDEVEEAKMIKMGFGTVRKTEERTNDSKYLQLKKEIEKVTKTVKTQPLEDIELRKIKNIYQELAHNLVVCPKLRKAVTPTSCVGCDNVKCLSHHFHTLILKKYGFDNEERLIEYIKAKGVKNG